MQTHKIEELLEHLRQGKKCYCGFEDEELSTVIAIEQMDHDMYHYSGSISHKYDVVSPVHYDYRTLNEKELKTLLNGLSDSVANSIFYVDKEIINENSREKLNLIYSYLKRSPKVVFVVLKEDRHQKNENKPYKNFHGVFNTRQQAEQIMEYLRSKQGAECSLKEITITLREEKLELLGELSQFDQVNSTQILVSLLDREVDQIAAFFHKPENDAAGK